VVDKVVFEASKWYTEILSLHGVYLEVNSFLASPDARNKHIETRPVFVINDDNEEAISLAMRNHIVKNLEEAEKFYNRQMVVIAVTYIELILKDFLTVIFRSFPDRMYDFLYAWQDKKGSVSLKDITKVNSLIDLLNNLSEQAASNALKGRFETGLDNLTKITKKKIPHDLRSELIRIVNRRNSIVHQDIKEEVNRSEVRGILESCLSLMQFLTEVAGNNNILLDEDAKRLEEEIVKYSFVRQHVV
jgi:uncharacterized protein YutE (UPF0331/DUF86 family)